MQLVSLAGFEVRKWRPYRTRATPYDRCACLDDAHSVSFAVIPQVDIGQEEVFEQSIRCRAIARGMGVVKLDRRPGDEVEHGRRVHRIAHCWISAGEHLRGRKPGKGR